MIGLFDSGCGGLTVLRAIRARAPQADIVYFGDIGNAPYGPKTPEELAVCTEKGRPYQRTRTTGLFCARPSLLIAPLVTLSLDKAAIKRNRAPAPLTEVNLRHGHDNFPER